MVSHLIAEEAFAPHRYVTSLKVVAQSDAEGVFHAMHE
jgi:hypothetical protein